MSARQTGTYEIGLDTPIHLLTPRQLFEMQSEWLAEMKAGQSPAEPGQGERWIVNSAKELAEILGTSETTVYRMKSRGLLNEAVSQYGKWMCFDVNKVLDIFRLSNPRKRK